MARGSDTRSRPTLDHFTVVLVVGLLIGSAVPAVVASQTTQQSTTTTIETQKMEFSNPAPDLSYTSVYENGFLNRDLLQYFESQQALPPLDQISDISIRFEAKPNDNGSSLAGSGNLWPIVSIQGNQQSYWEANKVDRSETTTSWQTYTVDIGGISEFKQYLTEKGKENGPTLWIRFLSSGSLEDWSVRNVQLQVTTQEGATTTPTETTTDETTTTGTQTPTATATGDTSTNEPTTTATSSSQTGGNSQSSGDLWPDKCSSENISVIDPGRHTGEFSPGDTDAFIIDNIKEGEYITVRTAFSSPAKDASLQVSYAELPSFSDTTLSSISGTDISSVENLDETYGGTVIDSTGIQYRIYSEGADQEDPGRICIELDSSNSVLRWGFSFERGKAEPPALGADDSEKVNRLQTKLQRKNQTIEAMESQIQEQNQTITALRAQLQNQTATGQPVSINVTVAPGGNQNSFRVGETASVTAEMKNADMSKLSVRYAGESYSLDESGAASIPLQRAGTQQMVFTYRNTTERIELDVLQQDTATTTAADEPTTETGTDPDTPTTTTEETPTADTTTEPETTSGETATATASDRTPTTTATGNGEIVGQDQTTTSDSGPGFGAVAAIIAILTGVYWTRRRL